MHSYKSIILSKKSTSVFNSLLSSIILFLLAFAPTSSKSENISIYNFLAKSSKTVVTVNQFCNKRQRKKLYAEYGIDAFSETKARLGTISPYGVTSHLFNVAKAQSVAIGIEINYAGALEKENCAALIIIDGLDENFEIKTSFRNFNIMDNLTPLEIKTLEIFKKQCLSRGNSAPNYFPYGQYFQNDDGTIYEDPFRISCDSAVKNNTSSVDINAKGLNIQVTTIYNVIFLKEQPQ